MLIDEVRKNMIHNFTDYKRNDFPNMDAEAVKGHTLALLRANQNIDEQGMAVVKNTDFDYSVCFFYLNHDIIRYLYELRPDLLLLGLRTEGDTLLLMKHASYI